MFIKGVFDRAHPKEQMAPPIKAFDRAPVDELEPESEPGRSSTK
jgi:hypothetical protein